MLWKLAKWWAHKWFLSECWPGTVAMHWHQIPQFREQQGAWNGRGAQLSSRKVDLCIEARVIHGHWSFCGVSISLKMRNLSKSLVVFRDLSLPCEWSSFVIPLKQKVIKTMLVFFSQTFILIFGVWSCYFWPENLNFVGGKGDYDLFLPCSELGDQLAGSSAGHAGAVPELRVSAFPWACFPFLTGLQNKACQSLLWLWKKIQNVWNNCNNGDWPLRHWILSQKCIDMHFQRQESRKFCGKSGEMKPSNGHAAQACTHTESTKPTSAPLPPLWDFPPTMLVPAKGAHQPGKCLCPAETSLHASQVPWTLPSVQMKRRVNAQSCAPGAKRWWSQNLHCPLGAKPIRNFLSLLLLCTVLAIFLLWHWKEIHHEQPLMVGFLGQWSQLQPVFALQ